MNPSSHPITAPQSDVEQFVERVSYDFNLNRRHFVEILGAGLLITVAPESVLAQRAGGRREGNGLAVAARIPGQRQRHHGPDGQGRAGSRRPGRADPGRGGGAARAG